MKLACGMQSLMYVLEKAAWQDISIWPGCRPWYVLPTSFSALLSSGTLQGASIEITRRLWLRDKCTIQFLSAAARQHYATLADSQFLSKGNGPAARWQHHYPTLLASQTGRAQYAHLFS